MSNSKSDKPLVRNLTIGCLVAILVFHFAWFRQLMTNYHNPFFVVVDLLLLGVFCFVSERAHALADDPNKEWLRVVQVVIAVALCAWGAGWAVGLNEKVL